MRKRATSPFPSPQPLTPLLSPSRSRLRGALTPVRRPEAGHRRRSLHSRKIMYQPSRGAARRLGPCLRAYQARVQVRAERKREGRGGGGERPSSAGAWGGARVAFRAGVLTSHHCFPPVRSREWRGEGPQGPEGGAASPVAHGTSVSRILGGRRG